MMSWWNREVLEESVLVRVDCPSLIPRIRSRRMRTKPGAHTACAHSRVILVIATSCWWCFCNWYMIIITASLVKPNTAIFCVTASWLLPCHQSIMANFFATNCCYSFCQLINYCWLLLLPPNTIALLSCPCQWLVLFCHHSLIAVTLFVPPIAALFCACYCWMLLADFALPVNCCSFIAASWMLL